MYIVCKLQQSSKLVYYQFTIVGLLTKYKSSLPLTDTRDAEAQSMLNIPYHIIW